MKRKFLRAEDYIKAAQTLSCSADFIEAVSNVESSANGGFITEDEPTILFERHYFHRLTKQRFSGYVSNAVIEIGRQRSRDYSRYAVLSSSSSGGYGPVSIQHVKLASAAKLDREMALRSCSWGLFQLMGNNYIQCGFPTIQSFINAMYRSVDDHLEAFINFIVNESRTVLIGSRRWTLIEALREENPRAFALIYNGAKQKGYDNKISQELVRIRTRNDKASK